MLFILQVTGNLDGRRLMQAASLFVLIPVVLMFSRLTSKVFSSLTGVASKPRIHITNQH